MWRFFRKYDSLLFEHYFLSNICKNMQKRGSQGYEIIMDNDVWQFFFWGVKGAWARARARSWTRSPARGVAPPHLFPAFPFAPAPWPGTPTCPSVAAVIVFFFRDTYLKSTNEGERATPALFRAISFTWKSRPRNCKLVFWCLVFWETSADCVSCLITVPWNCFCFSWCLSAKSTIFIPSLGASMLCFLLILAVSVSLLCALHCICDCVSVFGGLA